MKEQIISCISELGRTREAKQAELEAIQATSLEEAIVAEKARLMAELEAQIAEFTTKLEEKKAADASKIQSTIDVIDLLVADKQAELEAIITAEVIAEQEAQVEAAVEPSIQPEAPVV